MPKLDAEVWLTSHDPISDDSLTEEQRNELSKLLGNPGFGVLISLLMADIQGCYRRLSRLNLADEQQRAQASVLQGRIDGIEALRTTMLELFPSDDIPA